jgi:hypothetical protein
MHYVTEKRASNDMHKWNAAGVAEYITALISSLAGKEI